MYFKNMYLLNIGKVAPLIQDQFAAALPIDRIRHSLQHGISVFGNTYQTLKQSFASQQLSYPRSTLPEHHFVPR
jgi:hypothetical protein